MNDDHLARIIATSIGPDGKPDTKRIYDALRLSPDDPATLLVDSVLTFRTTQQEYLELLRSTCAVERGELEAIMRNYAGTIAEVAKLHSDAITAFRRQTDALKTDITKAVRRSMLIVLAAGLAIAALASALIFLLVK